MILDIPQPLIDDIVKGSCLPLVGAGFSMNAHVQGDQHMPDWKGLTATLASIAGVSPELPGPEVAAHYERKFGRVGLIEAIRKALHVDLAAPGEAHQAFVKLPFDTVYTTNFDLLLEEACSMSRKPHRSLVGQQQLPFHGGTLMTSIVKMHGDLRHEEHIIITEDDYKHYFRRYPVIATHLSAMLITRTALFIGYSMSDPDFRNILKVVRSRLGRFLRMSYLVQFDASTEEFDSKLGEGVHMISLAAKSPDDRDKALAAFFTEVLQQVDAEKGSAFRAAKPEAFEDMPTQAFRQPARLGERAALLGSSSYMCFVAMPFSSDFQSVYLQVIKPACEALGLDAVRADEIMAPGNIIEQVRVAIQNARLIIADVTGGNANVLYEVGLAHSLEKPTLLLANNLADVPFDIRSQRLLLYDKESLATGEAETALRRALEQVLIGQRLEEGRRLVESGAFSAAVAQVSIALETALRALLTRGEQQTSRLPSLRLSSIRIMLDTLARSNVLDEQELASLRRCNDIRNRTVHGLREASQQEAIFALDVVSQFIRKHISGLSS